MQDLADRIRRIKLLVFDFDGVFTDNAVFVFEDGREAVRCSRLDGMGITLMRRLAGPEMMILSTEVNQVVNARAVKLKIACEHGCSDKGARLTQIVAEKGLIWEEVAYVGNDINDFDCLRMAGLAIGPSDAHHSVDSLLDWKTKAPGGNGAVREICDAFLAVLKDESV